MARREKGWRKREKREARLERIEARQSGKTDRVAQRQRGGRGIDAGKVLEDAGEFAQGFADNGLLGSLLGGFEDDEPAPMVAEPPVETEPVDDGPSITEDPIGWVKENPGKAAAGAAAVAVGLKLARVI